MGVATSRSTCTGYCFRATYICAVLHLCLNPCFAQTMQRHPPASNAIQVSRTKPGSQPVPGKSDEATEQTQPISGMKAGTPFLPANESPQPSRVAFLDGKLMIDANNSNLGEILQNVAESSGMTVNKLDNGPRIFGVYGPGSSREVLVDLLRGSGYNFIMVGGTREGPPRELILTAQKSSVRRNSVATAVANSVVTAVVDGSAENDTPKPPDQESTQPSVNPLGPGAVAPVPSLDTADDSTRAAANQQRLQHIQEQQQNPPQ